MREIKRFNDDAGEWDQPVMVKVNGKEYPTQLYKGVQRFVPNRVVGSRLICYKTRKN